MELEDSPFATPDIDDEIDDFVDDDEDIDEVPGSYQPAARAQRPEQHDPVDMRTPVEKTTDLIKEMPAQRKVLRGILAYCETPVPLQTVYDHIAEMQQFIPGVYGPETLCTHLERSGGIERVTADGEPYEEAEVAPKLVEVDGVAYYETQEAPEVYLKTTDAGLDVLGADNARERLEELFASNDEFLDLYQRVLDLSCADDGASVDALSKAVDDDPRLRHPRRYVQYFVNGLEQGDAIEWKGAWFITDLGREAQTMLAEQLQAPATEGSPAAANGD